MEDWTTVLKEALGGPLPGIEAQMKMAPSMRKLPVSNLPQRKGSVMILLYMKEKSIYTLFMKRAEYDGVHSGQISFPGGIYEAVDLNLANTAIRETEEETGIPAGSVKVLGQLTLLHIPVSNVTVYPFVSTLKEPPEFHPDPKEVDYLIEARLDDLVNPSNQKVKTITIGDNLIKTPYFDMNDNHIWGATAMILSEFLEIIKRAGIC